MCIYQMIYKYKHSISYFMAFNTVATHTESHINEVFTASELIKGESQVGLELIPL